MRTRIPTSQAREISRNPVLKRGRDRSLLQKVREQREIRDSILQINSLLSENQMLRSYKLLHHYILTVMSEFKSPVL